jgi:hypothetical protein
MISTQQRPKLEITTVKPIYGDNYNRGYIGFTYHNDNVIAKGISYFTKWERMSDIYATHALIVTGENSCIEANAFQNCVKEGTLDHYFEEPHCQIFFREPKEWTDEIGDRIVQVLNPEVGRKYDFNLILAQALSGTALGHFWNRILQGVPKDKVSEILNSSKKWICSELAAYALDEQPEYHDQGILKRPDATISPQALFEDPDIFESWKDGKVTQCTDCGKS